MFLSQRWDLGWKSPVFMPLFNNTINPPGDERKKWTNPLDTQSRAPGIFYHLEFVSPRGRLNFDLSDFTLDITVTLQQEQN